MADLTILDAPETPAPLFAFRALKSAIFGSPNDDDERNKENFNSKAAQALSSKTSIVRAMSLSPSKRRKANPCPSPAKSILRAPGIPTPRKQNTNVTFKDLTPSLSPVLRRQDNVTTEQPRVQTTELTNGATISRTAQPKLKSVRVAAAPAQDPASEYQIPRTAIAVERASTMFDIEAYKRSTEKEMKKLVRYGQKMREFARNQEQENTKLRITLEKLQRENEELRQREIDCESRRLGKEKESQSMKEGLRSRVIDTNSTSRSVEETSPKQLSTNRADTKSTQAAAAPRGLSPHMPKALLWRQRPCSPLKRKASTQLMPEPLLPETLARSGRSVAQVAKSSNSARDGQTAGSTSARLPPDRLAAARERVRRKAELRKAADANPSSPDNWDAL